MFKPFLVSSLLLSSSVSLFAACDTLYISEYIEGSSYNKAIELYNPSEMPLDLSSYTLELYSNGNAEANARLELTGSLEAHQTYVIANSRADAQILSKSDLLNGSVINFNGDDALVLRQDGTIIDALGQVGVDPGSAWSNNGISTKDQTLLRHSSAECDTDINDIFDPSLGYDGFEKDTFSYLGSINAQEPEEPEVQFAYIHDVQGASEQSPMLSQEVEVEGIVVGNYLKSGLKGFFIQEEEEEYDNDLNSSEGIFVYCPNCDQALSLGALVRVSGEVSEYAGGTQIKAKKITLSALNLALPQAVSIELPLSKASDYERYEGMLVDIHANEGSLYVNENYNLGRYGSFTLASKRLFQYTQTHQPDAQAYSQHQAELKKMTIIVDDGSSYQNPENIIFPSPALSADNTFRSGYSIEHFVGVMDQRFGSYRIQANALSNTDFDTQSNPRTTAPEKAKLFPLNKGRFFASVKRNRQLRVASYNVLNYFNTFKGCSYGVGGEEAQCRGADNLEEFERQRNKIIAAMLEIDADIFGLMEIENDGYDASSALADLVYGLNEALGEERFNYVNVDEKLQTLNALGEDAIKVALIYNQKRVKPVGKPHALKLDENDKNRPSLLQRFKKRHGAKQILVSVNHLKSKGSNCDALSYEGVADIDLKDGQGNCNLTRTNAAEKLTHYIQTQPKLARKKNVILLGDFNAYAKEDPIRLIEDKNYINALAKKEGLEAYSYVFKAEAGTLDYAFVSKRLSKKILHVEAWHSNTDEPRVLDYNLEYKSDAQHETLYAPDAYRASDHDPIIVDLKF